MKTFTLNIPKESWNWSYTLDIRTILCNRSWILFNDEHEKEVYIFQEAGTLIVSQNGKVNKTKWEYITQNASLIIENINSGTYMLKPTYYDKKVLVLQVYGTNEYVIMFNENNLDELMLNSIDKVKQYIEKQQENADQTTKVSFTPHKNNQEGITNENIKNDLTLHETRLKPIRHKHKSININMGTGIIAVSFLIYSVLNNEILSIYAFGIFSFIIITLLVVLIFRDTNNKNSYNTFLKIEKKHPLQWFNQ